MLNEGWKGVEVGMTVNIKIVIWVVRKGHKVIFEKGGKMRFALTFEDICGGQRSFGTAAQVTRLLMQEITEKKNLIFINGLNVSSDVVSYQVWK